MNHPALKKTTLTLSALLLSLIFFAPVQAASHLRPEIDQLVQNEIQKQQLVGLALGVVEKVKITYLQGYGYANAQTKEIVSPQSMFRWASVSKPLTAILAMQLVEAGKLDLDTPIQNYNQNFDNPQHLPLSLRQLLNHQGGYGHYDDTPNWQAGVKTYFDLPPKSPQNPALQFSASRAFDTIFKNAPLLFRPGLNYNYSTFGYILAGAVIADRGKAPYLNQFESRIKKPLGLTTLQPDYQAAYIPYRVTGYYLDSQKIKVRADNDVSWKLPGGGFISNLEDMTQFMRGIMGNQLLHESSKKQMWTRQTTLDGKETSYGLGFGLADNQPAGLRVEHFGGQAKTRTLLSFYPQAQTGIVIMTNSEWANLASFRDQIFPRLIQ